MIYCNTLKREFATKKERFSELIKHKQDIIRMKCADIRKSDPIALTKKDDIEFATKDERVINKPLELGDKIKCVISTMLYLDSHSDVHAIDMFKKSVAEQQGKVYHAIDHELSVTRLVADTKDVDMSLEVISWSELGLPQYNGYTQILTFTSKLSDITHEKAFKAYKKGMNLLHSVRMQYVNLVMCINDAEYKEEYGDWLKYRPLVANGDKADDEGFFFYIKEAKIYKEGSTVLSPSNDATPYFYTQTTNEQEPIVENITQEQKSESISKDEFASVLNNFLNK